jgi:hypothetical protein
VHADKLVVEGGGEDRGQDRLHIGDGGGRHIAVIHAVDPLAHVQRGDVAHPHRPELGQQVFVDLVAVALPGGALELVVRQPGAGDVRLEGDLAAAWVASLTEQGVGFGDRPGPVGFALGGEGAGGAALPAQVGVDRGIAGLAVDADPLVRVPHGRPPGVVRCCS